MTTLLSCIDRGIRDLEIQEKISLKIHNGTQDVNRMENVVLKMLIVFAAHAASVSNILCGVRARETLDKIENGDYFQDLHGWREIIICQSTKILENEAKHH